MPAITRYRDTHHAHHASIPTTCPFHRSGSPRTRMLRGLNSARNDNTLFCVPRAVFATALPGAPSSSFEGGSWVFLVLLSLEFPVPYRRHVCNIKTTPACAPPPLSLSVSTTYPQVISSNPPALFSNVHFSVFLPTRCIQPSPPHAYPFSMDNTYATDKFAYIHVLLFRCPQHGEPLLAPHPSDQAGLEEVDAHSFSLKCECGWSGQCLGLSKVKHWVEKWNRAS